MDEKHLILTRMEESFFRKCRDCGHYFSTIFFINLCSYFF